MERLEKKYLIVIGGPTASGKTALAIELAKHFQTEILSCDSRQFFKEMNIGTAKPDAHELASAPHHFINSRSIFDDYSVGEFERDALAFLSDFYQKKEVAILVGGSGLYIRALCEGLDNFPTIPEPILKGVEQDLADQGLEFLQEELKKTDPEYFAEVDLQNSRRIIRALSVIRASGQPFSSFRRQGAASRPFQPIYVLLEMERQTLYNRINRRVDLMLEAGLFAEARNLFPFKNQKALQTVGYQEFFQYFMGKIPLEKAIELVKRNSRRYAKRQMTWFRKRTHWHRFAAGATPQIISFLEEQVNSRLSS